MNFSTTCSTSAQSCWRRSRSSSKRLLVKQLRCQIRPRQHGSMSCFRYPVILISQQSDFPEPGLLQPRASDHCQHKSFSHSTLESLTVQVGADAAPAQPHFASENAMTAQGTLVNETRCLQCETVTSREEAFYDLSLEIEQNSSLTSCLQNFRHVWSAPFRCRYLSMTTWLLFVLLADQHSGHQC